MSVDTILKLNKRFRLPEHPFNDRSGDVLAYAEWEYGQAERSLACFAPYYAPGDMLFRKKVLDIGCGAGGKSVCYAKEWSADVTGVDLEEKYETQAAAIAKRKGVRYADEAVPEIERMLSGRSGSFRFVCADAADTGLPAESFDTVIMNDAFEHLADPEAVLKECARVLKPGGKVFINFPPYGHPYGEHLSDLIGIPWVHKLFPEQQCLEAYKALAEELDAGTAQDEKPAVSGAERIAFRLSEDENGALKNSYINKMTLRRFKEILKTLQSEGQRAARTSSPEAPGNTSSAAGLRLRMYKELPLRKWLTPLAKIPGIKESFVRMAVCVLEKSGHAEQTKQNGSSNQFCAQKNTKIAGNT